MSDRKTRRSGDVAAVALGYIHDLAVGGLAMAGVLMVRYRFEDKPTPYLAIGTATAVFVALAAIVFPLFKLNRTMWRFTTLNDIVRVASAAAVVNLMLVPVLFAFNRGEDFPRSAPFFGTLGVTLALCLGRAFAHVAASGDFRGVLHFEDRSLPATVIVGRAADAAAFLKESRRTSDARLRVAGIVVLDDAPVGRIIAGAEVLGQLGRLAAILKALGARDAQRPQLVLAHPRPSRALLDEVVAAAGEAGAAVARARPANGSGGGALLTPVQAADLLDRPPRNLDVAAPAALVAGRRVMVTGAGGTIGAELTRQIVKLGPERLILLDASEFNLYAIDQELTELKPACTWTSELGDVRDAARLRELFLRERPEVVLHAAALKHVPLMELNPAEAVLTNVGGALNVAKRARDTGAAFVFISTDKAVNPTNVMGATKRVAERVVQALCAGSEAKAAIVRFGNVLGSAGSVVPLFERQIAHGGPVTVTHPEMERYFMTVQEAASLVLQAASLPAETGEAGVYVLDMGEPVRIEALARQVIRLHGLRPGADIDIVHTGLRPGEKLFEEIFYAAEDVRPTAADGVLRACASDGDWSSLEKPVQDLLTAAAARNAGEVLARLRALEPAFKPG